MKTRTEYVRKNLIINVSKYIVNMVMQFVLRTVLIYTMGAEYIGLNGLFTNIFAFLNLAELGIGGAIVFSMYKPIAENNVEKIKSLQALYKKFYFIIFLIILIIGGLITPFVKLLIKNDVTVDINIYLLFVMYLANTLAGYLSAHKRSLLFANQRADIENTIRMISILAMSVVQILVLVILKNYYVFFGVNIIATIIECIMTHVICNKYYPEINSKNVQPLDKETKKEITQNITAMSMHKVGGVIVGSTDNILISIFFGIVILGAYSNYLLVTTAILSIMQLFVTAIQGSIGNYIASKSDEEIYKKFLVINFMFAFVSQFVTICFFVLIQPFIKWWTGGGEYLLEVSSVLILSLNVYFSRRRTSINVFKDCAGLFWKDRWSAVAEAGINLVTSVVLAYFWGINGIFLGTLVSTLLAPFWVEPKVLFKYCFKRSPKQYFIRYFVDFLVLVSVGILVFFVCSFLPEGGLLLLALRFVVCIILSFGLLMLVYFKTPECRELISVAKKMLMGLLKKKPKNHQDNGKSHK